MTAANGQRADAGGEGSKTVLVSGGTGFIGRSLVSVLHQQGHHVRTFGRAPRAETLPTGIDYWQFDLDGAQLIDQMIGDVDVLIHAAGASTTTSDAQEMEDVNVCGTAQLAQAAYEAGVGRMVYVSTSSVYGTKVSLPQPISESVECHPSPGYGETKLRAEQAVREVGDKGLETAILRPATVFGPGAVKLVASTILDAAIERYAGLSAFEVPSEPIELRLVHIDDVVAACWHLATAPTAAGGVFNLTAGVYPDSHEVGAALADELGLELKLTDDAEPGLPVERRQQVRDQMLAEGMSNHIVLSSERIRFLRKANPNNRLSLDALEATGFSPQVTDIPAAVRESVRWYQAHRWIL